MALTCFRQWFNLQRSIVPDSDKRGGEIYVEEFSIPQARMAIGPKGCNINAARRIEGVMQINSTNRFIATTKTHLFQVGS